MNKRATVEVKVSAEVNTILRDLFNQIQYELCEQYEDKFIDNYIKHLEEEKECYKSRIKKAIEYIDEHTLFVNGGIIKSILNGSDDNE